MSETYGRDEITQRLGKKPKQLQCVEISGPHTER